MVGKDWQQRHKDLLCFAWQIVKGMACLADMKVGHGW
jgi:hypothetical protein